MNLIHKSWLNNRRYAESSYDFKVDFGKPHGLKPQFIYGTLCNMQVYPNVRYCPNAIVVADISTVMQGTGEFKSKDDIMIWCGTDKEPGIMKMGNITIDLTKYTKEKVVEFLKRHIPGNNFHDEVV